MLNLVFLLISLAVVTGFRAIPHNFRSFQLRNDKIDLDRELELFFEQASNQGSAKIAKLTPEERVELAIRGEFLEDEIFAARERLMDLEERYMKGDKSIEVEEINQLRDEIRGLKDDYIVLVGAKDIPLYFGRLPDGLQ